ncbi:MAG: class I SAM-dependent methyltransferase [Opitutaceae bacterium]|nr:class I SAM-dependent methyltransferase [Opitutaceae bacterium]
MKMSFGQLWRRSSKKGVDPSPSEAVTRPAIVVGCSIRDVCVVRDVLFVRGLVQRRAGESPRISVRIWTGAMAEPVLSDDQVIHSNADTWAFSFHLSLPPKASPADHEKITLCFDYSDGRYELSNPTQDGHSRDAFLNSETSYWTAVSEAPGARVLEIGSRARSGISRRNLFPEQCEYVGFDIVAGENVSVVGDAHSLSRYFPPDHFDFVFSVSVWEHLAMPWLVSVELNKVMKPGGLAMINTHQSWPVHEEPWDYFRFSDYAWDSLFNEATGFEIVARGMGQPCIMAPALVRSPPPATGSNGTTAILPRES